MALIDVENNSNVPNLQALGGKNIASVISDIIPLLITIAGFALLLYLVAGGYGMMTSKGDPKAVEAAKAKITSALIGFTIIAIGYLLVQVVGLIFGVSDFGGVFK